MRRLTDRRAVLMAAGTVAAAAVAGTVSAQAADIQGTVAYEGGAAIPAGEIVVYIQDPADKDVAGAYASGIRVPSDGASDEIEFSVPAATGRAAAQTQIIARLERSDGWLLARGSAELEPDGPVEIVLHTAMY